MLLARPVRTEVIMTSLIVTATAIVAPAVSAAIGHIEMRVSEIEVVAMRIAGIDAEVPVACLPVEWAIEIRGGTEQIPLPAIEDITDIQVATLPVQSKHVALTGDAHQIIQVNLIGSLILCVRQVQLIGHLVRQEKGLSASLFV